LGTPETLISSSSTQKTDSVGTSSDIQTVQLSRFFPLNNSISLLVVHELTSNTIAATAIPALIFLILNGLMSQWVNGLMGICTYAG